MVSNPPKNGGKLTLNARFGSTNIQQGQSALLNEVSLYHNPVKKAPAKILQETY